MTPEEFRAAGHVLIDWIADHRSRLPELPVQSQVTPGQVAAGLAPCAPTLPEPFGDVMADLQAVVLPGITQTQHPRFFGWFPSNATLSSVLGDLASSGLGALGITWQSAPALTEVEEVVTEWLRELTGLSPQWKGAIHDTASTACLVAMLAARERATDYSQARGGLQDEPAPLTVYTTAHAHSSVQKAVLLAGYGRDNLRFVDVDQVSYAMRPEALAAMVTADLASGHRPAAVVVSVGTTGTTAVDPLAQVLPIARAHGLWVHVDAAMAGSALLLPEMRWLVDGINGSDGAHGSNGINGINGAHGSDGINGINGAHGSDDVNDSDDVNSGDGAPAAPGRGDADRTPVAGADSLSWNPHKWLGTILDCSLLYVRDPEHLVRALSTNPSYLRSAVDGEVTQYKDWGIPLGRRFRALKLWFHLRLDGVEAIRARLRRDLANALWLAELVRAAPGWRVLAPVNLQTVCVRHEPPGLVGEGGAVLDAAALDAHTLAWVDAISSSGEAFLTPSLLDGHWMARVSIGAEATERPDVAALWDLMRAAAEGRPPNGRDRATEPASQRPFGG
jgi:glutamate/tyrosine decarboxylase-like PLP-dependent enzyme